MDKLGREMVRVLIRHVGMAVVLDELIQFCKGPMANEYYLTELRQDLKAAKHKYERRYED